MAWDEALFSLAWNGARRALGRRAEDLGRARRFELVPERERLEALARLLSGAPLGVKLGNEIGGLQGDTLFLPSVLEWAPTRDLNEAAALVRVAWACATHELGLTSRAADPLLDTALASRRIKPRVLELAPALAEPLDRLERATLAARQWPETTDESRLAVEALVRLALGAQADHRLPASVWAWAQEALSDTPRPLPAAHRRLFSRRVTLEPVPLWGSLLPPAMTLPAVAVPVDDGSKSSGTERQKRAAGRVQRIQEPEDPQAENPLVHSFEKVHTLEEYRGGSKRADGDDELAAHQKALDELDLRQVVRSHRRAHSVYRADVLLDAPVGDVSDEAPTTELSYDEWDDAHRSWKRNWCRLTSRPIPSTPDAADQLKSLRAQLTHTTKGLRAVFEQLEASRVWKLRQRQGTDVDVDAVVGRYGALRSGHCSEDRLYATRRRHTRDTAILLLLDASLSTDGWVANRRVLDLEKEAVLALADSLDGLFDDVAVAAFCSQTRRDCRFLVAKGFREPWATGAHRLVSLEPAGFTRIGPAIRHATAELNTCGARQKLLLLVSDGKPSDADQYEGRYGIADVHRAVLDAQATGVVTHALAVDPAARAWLPSMFGPGRSSVVARPEELVSVLATVTSQALRR